MRALVLFGFLVCAALAVGTFVAPGAGAHAELESSEPANVSTVAEPVDRVTLRFTKPSEPALEGFAIEGPQGPVGIAGVDASDDGLTVVVDPDETLAGGRFRLTWAIRAGDTHTMNGTIAFTVSAASPEEVATAPISAPTDVQPRPAGTPDPDTALERDSDVTAAPTDLTSAVATNAAEGAERLATVLRWLTYVAMALCVGGVAYLSVIHRGPRGETIDLVFIIRRAAAGLLVLSALAFVAQLSVFDGGSWFASTSPSAWGDVLSSGYGPATLLRLVGAALVLAFVGTTMVPTAARGRIPGVEDQPGTGPGAPDGGVALRVRRRRRTEVRVVPTPLAVLGVVALLASETFLGHTADTTPRVVVAGSDAIHLAAGGTWMAGVVLLLATVTRRRRAGGPSVAPLVLRFSQVAVLCVVAVAVTGIVMGALILGEISALFGSSFGRLLLAKITLVALLVGLGAYNQRTLLPAMSGPEPDDRALSQFRWVLSAEAAIFVAVLGLTGALVNSSPV